MPDRAPDLQLHIAGTVYSGWQSVAVTRSIEQLSGTFEVTATDKWALDDQQLQLACGQAARVTIGGETVITGHIDEVAPRISATEHSIRVRGRDAAGDLVDCSVLDASQEIVGRNLLQVAQSICRPFGVAVRANVDIGGEFTTTHFQVGETAYEVLARLARMRGVLCVSDGRGGLLFTRAGDRVAATSLGDNILEGSAMRSQRDRFARYRVLGQQRGTDTIGAEQAAQTQAECEDPAIDRYRPLIVFADDPAAGVDCAARARWERSVRAGRANTAVVTVAGWLDGEAPWQPNTLIDAEYRSLGLSGRYLITDVTYRIDDNAGRVTELGLTPPAALELLNAPSANPAGESALFEGAS